MIDTSGPLPTDPTLLEKTGPHYAVGRPANAAWRSSSSVKGDLGSTLHVNG